jgi:hypothetical protein
LLPLTFFERLWATTRHKIAPEPECRTLNRRPTRASVRYLRVSKITAVSLEQAASTFPLYHLLPSAASSDDRQL